MTRSSGVGEKATAVKRDAARGSMCRAAIMTDRERTELDLGSSCVGEGCWLGSTLGHRVSYKESRKGRKKDIGAMERAADSHPARRAARPSPSTCTSTGQPRYSPVCARSGSGLSLPLHPGPDRRRSSTGLLTPPARLSLERPSTLISSSRTATAPWGTLCPSLWTPRTAGL